MSVRRRQLIASLDRWFPPCGPCAFCGHPDKRHRLWDALMGRAESKEGVRSIAADYDLPAAAVFAVLTIRPYTGSQTRVWRG